MLKYTVLGLLIFLGASSVFAQEISISTEQFKLEEELLLLEERVVESATKTKKKVPDVPATVTVITAEEIRNMGARDLMDVLRIVPGINIARHLYGIFMTIEVRGIRTNNSEKVLLMVDGLPIKNYYNNSPTRFFDDLVVGNIKQVEIIRSPASAIYGTGAFLAVINIITKKAEDIDGARVSAGTGSFETQAYTALFGKVADKFGIDGYFDYLRTDGPRLWIEEDVLYPAAYSQAPGYTQSWNRKTDVNLRGSYGDVTLWGKYLEKRRGAYIGAAYALNDESVINLEQYLTGALIFDRAVNSKLNVMARLSATHIQGANHFELYPEGYPGFPDGMLGEPRLKTNEYAGEVKLDYAIGKSDVLTVGAFYEKINLYDVQTFANYNPNTYAPLAGGYQDISAWGNYTENAERFVKALYLQNDLNLLAEYNIDLLLGARYDHYSDFGGAWSPRTGLIWRFLPDMDLKLLYGLAFNAPDFEQLYIKNNPSTTGNPDLKPEKVQTSEVGLVYRVTPKINTSVTYFYSKITDLIQIRSRRYENFGLMETNGVEAEIRTDFSEGNYSFINYTYQNPQRPDTVVQDVPKHLANLGVNLKLNDYLNSDTIVHYTGSRRREQGDTRDKLRDYTTVDQTFILGNFYNTMEIRASVYNLFDVKSEDPAPRATIRNDFPRPGISYFLELAYNF